MTLAVLRVLQPSCFSNLFRLEIIAVLLFLQLSCRGKLDFLNGAIFEHFSLLNGVGRLAGVSTESFFPSMVLSGAGVTRYMVLCQKKIYYERIKWCYSA